MNEWTKHATKSQVWSSKYHLKTCNNCGSFLPHNYSKNTSAVPHKPAEEFFVYYSLKQSCELFQARSEIAPQW